MPFATHKKYVAQLQNLALSYEERVRPDNVSHNDMREFTFSYWLGVSGLMQGRSCLPSVVGGFKRLLNGVLESGDLLGFIEACSHIRAVMMQTGYWSTSLFTETKLRWVKGICMAVEHTIDINLCVHPSDVFNTVATFLGWLKRLPVCIRSASDSIAEYYENDARIASIDFDANEYTIPLREIWEEWLESFELTDPFLPGHGSGATADVGRVRAMKWFSLGWDAVARVCFRLASLEVALDLPVKPLTRVAKLVFVPKQAGKDRTICMEPAWLQYLQQGVRLQLSSFTHQGWHPLSKFTDLSDQTVNQRLCAEAIWHSLATIDLSNASDSVSWRLIRRLTERIPLGRYLLGSRSTSTLIAGEVVSFDKFAPMGSALCFPIECILFASVVELAYRMHYGQASKGHLSGCSVYGDDIICPSEIFHLVVQILVSIGFVVNPTKSFSSGAYYESCGVEYVHGVRVETLRHPRTLLLPKREMSPEQVNTVVDLSNSLLSMGWSDARRILLVSYKETYAKIGRRLVPFQSLIRFDDKHCLSILPNHGPRVWSVELQTSGIVEVAVEIVAVGSSADFLEWKCRNVPRTRLQRTMEMVVHSVQADPKWSRKGLTFLARFRCWDLIKEGKVETFGAQRTGRMHYKLRKRFRSIPG